jgi:hypothetical protein
MKQLYNLRITVDDRALFELEFPTGPYPYQDIWDRVNLKGAIIQSKYRYYNRMLTAGDVTLIKFKYNNLSIVDL